MSQGSTPKQHSSNSATTINATVEGAAVGAFGKKRSTRATPFRKKTVAKNKTRPKPPKVTAEQLKAVIYAVFSEADDDGNGDLDINECRTFCRKLMHVTFPEMVWDEERYK